MSSQPVVEGDREPVQSRDYAPKNSDDVSVPERSSTDQVVQNDNPRIADIENEARPPASRSGSRAQRTRGSPEESTRNRSYLQTEPAGLIDVMRETLMSDEMTSRACRLIITLAVGLAIVLVPVAAVAFVVMLKAAVAWKVIVGAGSTVFISVGSWLFGRRRSAKKSRRLLITDSSEEPT
jgi:hypothetical protein